MQKELDLSCIILYALDYSRVADLCCCTLMIKKKFTFAEAHRIKQGSIAVWLLILGLFVFIEGVVLGGIAQAQSQEAVGLTISPLTFELTANPSDVLSNKVRVYNPTDSAIGVRMEAEDFAVSGEMGQIRIEPAETETYSLARWVKISPDNFTLEPKEQKVIDFTIDVPPGAEPGGHYGSILATIGGVTGENITGAAIAQKVGSLVLLSVAGQVKEDLLVKEFTVPNFLEYGPVNFKIRFENKGTIHVRPKGFITITDWRDKKVVDIEFPQVNVIPGAVRKVEVKWGQKWLFGRYAATLVGSYGVSNTPINPYIITFWVIPWKIVTGFGFAALVLLLFLFKTKKRWALALRILIRGEGAKPPKQSF